MDSCGNSQKKKACDLVLFDRRITILHKYPLMLLFHAMMVDSTSNKKDKMERLLCIRGKIIYMMYTYMRGLLIFIRKMHQKEEERAA